MMNRKRFFAALATLLLGAAMNNAAANPEAEWRFRVLLDDKEIGEHSFILNEKEGIRRLTSEASFEVRLLFVTLFEYQHRNEETWQGNCLKSIESETDSNGTAYRVEGQLVQGRFDVRGTAGAAQLPPCVMTFAYWNPSFLQQDRLLNSQNGEFVEVEVSEPESDRLNIGGKAYPALRYRLRAGDKDLLLWYSREGQDWLALETKARGGRTLRYERM